MVDRLLPHTSDDDHTRYRSPVEILEMQSRDPIELTFSNPEENGNVGR